MDPKKDYGVERQTVAAFLVKHQSHEGVQSALKWLTGWLAAAEGGEQVPGAREMQRLASAGVSPLAILTESAALFLFAYCSPRTLPDDDRLTYALHIEPLRPYAEKARGAVVGG